MNYKHPSHVKAIGAVNTIAVSENIRNHFEAIADLAKKLNCGTTLWDPSDWQTLASEAEVKKHLKSWANPASQKFLCCLVRQIFIQFVLDQSVGYQNPAVINDKLARFFGNWELLNFDASTGAWKSAEGIATRVDIALKWLTPSVIVPKFAVVKFQQDHGTPMKEDLLNEIAVGLTLNDMRDYLPCFMTVYGGFYCGYASEADMKAKNFAALCKNNSNMHACMVSEWIENKESIEDFTNDPARTKEDKEKVVLMLLFALAEAWDRHKFVHGDLHGNNVIIRETAFPEDYSFVFRGQTLTINTKWVPVVIDYGMSSVEWNGKKLTPIFENDTQKDWWACNNQTNKAQCAAENLNANGADLGGYDIIRLFATGGLNVGALGQEIIDLINKCFYNGAYEYTVGGRLSASAGNADKFSKQGIAFSKDVTANPMCADSFLGELLKVARIRSLCGLP